VPLGSPRRKPGRKRKEEGEVSGERRRRNAIQETFFRLLSIPFQRGKSELKKKSTLYPDIGNLTPNI
jgi:hypothetical protein